MVESYVRQSALAHLRLGARAVADADLDEAGVVLSERPFRGQIVLRGDGSRRAFLDAVRRALGVAPPTRPTTAAGATHPAKGTRILWLGPDEWLVVTAADRARDLAASLAEALRRQHAAVTDAGDGRAVIGLTGLHAREVLMKGCPLDLDPRAFGPGRSAGTLLARAQVVLDHLAFDGRTGVSDYDIYVARSFAEYLWAWLEDGAREYGVKVAQDR